MRSLLEEPRLTVDAASGRHRRRLPRPRITKRRLVIGAVTAVVVVAALVYLFFFSQVFSLKQVVVQGVRTVPPSQIVQLAQLHSGDPLAGIDTDLVASRVSGMQTIASVQVSRRWPDTVVVDVVERDRVAAIKSGGQFDVLDQTGYVIEHRKRRPDRIPLLGEAGDDSAKLAALVVVHGLSPALAGIVESVAAPTVDEITLKIRGGVTVMWGGTDDSDQKARVLQALLGHLGGDKWVDLRSASNPATARNSPTPAPPPTTPTPGIPGSAAATVPSAPADNGSAVPVPVPSTHVLPGVGGPSPAAAGPLGGAAIR